MSSPLPQPLHGHCLCTLTSYTLTSPPLITHCCHCTTCQSRTGTAFALNAVIEHYNLLITSAAQPVLVNRPTITTTEEGTKSASPYVVAQCANPECGTELYAHYAGNETVAYVKVGTLDGESRGRVRPDVHIFTRSKAEWVGLESEVARGARVFEGFYEREGVWSGESLARLARLREVKR